MQAFRFRGFGVQGSGTWVYLRVRVSLGVLGFAVQSLGVLDFWCLRRQDPASGCAGLGVQILDLRVQGCGVQGGLRCLDEGSFRALEIRG